VIVDHEVAEVAHEALLRDWPRLANWLDEDREGRRVHERLTAAALTWIESGRDPSELYRGTRLDGATEWATEHDDDLSTREREFLEASRVSATRELDDARSRAVVEARRSRRLRTSLIGIAVLLVVALLTAGVAIQRDSAAQRAQDAAAVEQRLRIASRLAGRANVLPPEQHDLRVLLAVEAHRLAPGPETEGALFRAITAEPATELHSLEFDPPTRFGLGVTQDGTLVAAVTPSGTVRIRDAASGDEIRQFETAPSGDAVFASFNRDNSWVAVTSSTGSVTVWGVADGRRIAGPLDIGAPGYALFDPISTTRLLVGGRDGFVAVWDLADPDRPTRRVLGATASPTKPDGSLLFYPAAKGGRVVAGSSNPSDGVPIVVLDIASGTEVARLTGSPGAISADGRLVALKRPDDAIEVVDADTGATLSAPMPQVAAPASVMSFDTAGVRLAVFDNSNQQVRVMNWRTGQQIESIEFPGITAGIFIDGDRLFVRNQARAAVVDLAATSAARKAFVPPIAKEFTTCCTGAYQFDSDGRVVANSTDGGGLVVVSDPDDPSRRREFPIPESARGRNFLASPNARTIATVDDSGRAELLDRATGRSLGAFVRPMTVVARWSPDSSALSLTYQDNATYIWRVGDEVPQLVRAAGAGVGTGAFTPVGQLAWRPDGQELLVGLYGSDVAMTLGRGPGRAHATELPPGQRMHGGVSYRPDGRAFALATKNDQTGTASVIVVDDSSGDVIAEHALDRSIGSITYYSGGRRLATLGEAGSDVIAQSDRFELWDASGFAPIATFDLSQIATALIASPDGAHVLMVNGDRTATVWDLRPSTWVARACEVANRTLTRREWKHYLPNIPYDPACR